MEREGAEKIVSRHRAGNEPGSATVKCEVVLAREIGCTYRDDNNSYC